LLTFVRKAFLEPNGLPGQGEAVVVYVDPVKDKCDTWRCAGKFEPYRDFVWHGPGHNDDQPANERPSDDGSTDDTPSTPDQPSTPDPGEGNRDDNDDQPSRNECIS
ncbi:MAG: hypothetical protein ACR2QF_11255, partial [Geminicoccaceae bacterium]